MSDEKISDNLRDALVGLVINHGLRSVRAFNGTHIIEVREPSIMELTPVDAPNYGLVVEVTEPDL